MLHYDKRPMKTGRSVNILSFFTLAAIAAHIHISKVAFR